jgi:N-acetylneuraminate synthase/N,N'-diacetyllegionaminate synthase
MTNKVYIIAEAGVNHNGHLDLALQLCDAAKEAGVDAVKFQTWKTEKIVGKNTAKADYQSINTNDAEESQFDMLKKLELSYDSFKKIQAYCKKIGIDFLSTPDEEDSLNFLTNELNMPIVKIGSGDVTNVSYLRKIAKTKLPVILSTGMSDLAQVASAYKTLVEAGATDITLLHCTTNYPCPENEVNLRAMLTLREAFKCKVGYSDHTMGVEVPIAAVAMGAEVIEKHFTLDKTMDGPDHKASLNPEELKYMVMCIRNIEQSLGDGIKRPNASEVRISKVVLKTIVAACPIKKGELLNDANLCVKRIGSGISSSNWDVVVGTIAKQDYQEDQPIEL